MGRCQRVVNTILYLLFVHGVAVCIAAGESQLACLPLHETSSGDNAARYILKSNLPSCLRQLQETSTDLNMTLNEDLAPFSHLLRTLLQESKWNHTIIMYDNTTMSQILLRAWDACCGSLSSSASILKVESKRSIRTLDLVLGLVSDPHIILLTGTNVTIELLRKADEYATDTDQQKNILYHSHWMVFSELSLIEVQAVGSSFSNFVYVPIETALEQTEKRQECKWREGRESWFEFELPGIRAITNRSTCIITKLNVDSDDRGLLQGTLPVFSNVWPNDDDEVIEENSSFGGMSMKRVGSWSHHKGLVLDQPLFPNIAYGLNRRRLSVTTNPWPPFVIKHDVNGTVSYTGMCMDLLTELARMLNFTYTMSEPPDGAWGYQANGSWNGMIGQLARREVDMMVAPISIQKEREDVMDYIYPYYYDYTVVLLRKPDSRSEDWKMIVKPFQQELWICVLASLILVSLVLTFISSCSQRPRRPNIGQRKCINTMTLNLSYLYAAYLNQGRHHLFRYGRERMVVGSWWLFCIVMYATYSGNLIAFLSVPRSRLPFQTLNEMVEQTQYRFGTTDGTYLKVLFQNAREGSIYRRLGEGIDRFSRSDPEVWNPSHAEQIKKVLKGKYAYINDKSSMEIAMREHCDLALAREEFLALNYAIGFQQHSMYTPLFSVAMVRIRESGILQEWKRSWWPRTVGCDQLKHSTAMPVTVLQLQGVFYCLALGLILAGLVVMLEACVLRRLRRQRDRSTGRLPSTNVNPLVGADRMP